MAQVEHLTQLQDKYYAKGFRIIAISKESDSLLESKLIEDKKANYWIASDPSGETMGRYTQPGRLGIPHAYLVDARGVVVAEGVPNEAQIEKLLESAFDADLGRDLHKALKSPQKAYEKGQIGKAWSAAARYVEHEDTAIAEDAKFLRGKAEAYAAFRRKLVEDAVASSDYESAMADLDEMPKMFDGMEVAGWAATKEKELAADEKVQHELKAMKALRKAQTKEERAEGKAKKMGPAVKAYKNVVKKYPGTRAAKLAEEALGRLPQ